MLSYIMQTLERMDSYIQQSQQVTHDSDPSLERSTGLSCLALVDVTAVTQPDEVLLI